MYSISDVVKINIPHNPTAHNRIGKIIEIDDNCYDETVFLVKYFNQKSGSGWFVKSAIEIADNKINIDHKNK